jgi:hydroxyacylglutathione hydrolase
MLFKRFYDDSLAQASYLIGSTVAGEALVVDANRDVEQYLEAARAEGVRVTHVTETHIHADFVSGSRELAHGTGARLFLSDEGAPDWRYDFAADAGATLLHDGDEIVVGEVRVNAIHTPGHTPEHLTFLVTDTAVAPEPMGALTGDFVFVGDVGRPDLLERAADVRGTMVAGARQLFASLQRFKALPDFLQIWPGHGAGSACGKAIGSVPQSTLGYERLFNWGVAAADEQGFVDAVLAGQPELPTYFAEMKRVNRQGPPLRGPDSTPPRIPPGDLRRKFAAGAVVVDTRPTAAFAAAPVAGALNIPLGRSFVTWAGWLVPYDRDVYLLVDRGDAERAADAARRLALIGLDRVAGYAPPDEAAGPAEPIAQIGAEDLARRLASGDVTLVDVRGRAEWEAGHVPGAIHIPLGYLAQSLGELPAGLPVVLQCEGGTRSGIGASLLLARGRRGVLNFPGGYREWSSAGRPVERENPPVGARG